MNDDTQETLARVDDLLKRYDEARARDAERKAEQDKAAQESETIRQARATKRSANLWAKLDRWEKERQERNAPENARNTAWLAQYRANVTQADGFAVTCGQCGHVGNFDDYVKDKLGFERPRGVFQCPACNAAIRRELNRSTRNIQLTPIQATL